MRDELVADIGDYGKYGLLRRLFGNPEEKEEPDHQLTLGVLWFYRENIGRDGNDLAYLNDRDPLALLDPFLHGRLTEMRDQCRRTVCEVQREGLLPVEQHHYFREVVQGLRDQWIGRACAQMARANVVFLDPDNGIEPPGGYNGQHVRIDDLIQLYNSEQGKSLIIYQHRDTRHFPTAEEQIHALVERLRVRDGRLRQLNGQRLNGQIRIFQWRERFFFIVFVHLNHQALNAALDGFANSDWSTLGNFSEETRWLGDLANHQR